MKMLKILLEEEREWINFVVNNLPGRIGRVIRRLYWKNRFKKSKNFTFFYGCLITGPGNIILGDGVKMTFGCCLYAHNNGSLHIGDRVSVNSNVIFGASDNGNIYIGNDVLIGPNVVMRASNHNYSKASVPINKQGHSGGKIVIEDDVWIGANAVILADVTIGRGAIVAAGAVVKDNVPPFSLAAGVPAKIVKEKIRE